MNIQELKDAIKNERFIVWQDPDPIDGNDYVVSHIFDLTSIEDWEDEERITIQYNKGGSEAEITIDELQLVLTVDEFMAQYGLGYDSLEELQEENAVWDFPLEELRYFIDEHEETDFVFIYMDGSVRLIEIP